MFMRMTGDDIPLSQLAVVMKKKGSGGPQEVDEETLDELAAGAKELEKAASPKDDDFFADEEAGDASND
jgi:hypothetical protein